MEQTLLRKIPVTELKPLISSSRSIITSGNSIILQPKDGFIVFDFSKTEATSCRIMFSRDSGNGIIGSHINGLNAEHAISSKTGQELIFNLGKRKILHIHRTPRSRGTVTINNLSLYGEVNKIDWNSALKKCDEYGCLRLVDGALYVSEGGFIRGKGVTVQTDPPNMFTKDGDLIKFGSTCRVMNIVFSDNTNTSSDQSQQIEQTMFNNVIFDTKQASFNQVFCNKSANASVGGVVLDRQGTYTFPVSNIQIGKKYLITLYASCLDGNGKLMFGLLPDNNTSKYTVVSGRSIRTFAMEVVPTLGESFSFSIWRHHSAKGRVQVSRIVIQEEGAQQPVLSKTLHHIDLVTNADVARSAVPLTPFVKLPTIGSTTLDIYRKEILNFAMIEAAKPGYKFGKVDIELKPRTWEMNNWVSKLCNFIDGVTVSSDQVIGCTKANTDNAILLTDINNLSPARRILLEEFIETPNQQMIDILKACELVGTPSLMNAQVLRSHIGNKVVQIPKYWPVYDIGSEPAEPYNLLICRQPSMVAAFLDAYKQKINKKLVVVGYRGKVLDCEFYDEFLPYQKLLSLILHSSAVIDFPQNIHYYSGVLDLAFSANKNIVTTNHWMNVSKPQVTVVNSLAGSGVLIPNFQEAVAALAGLVDKKPNLDLESYNHNLIGTLRILGEIW